jgi:hypothetical protein
MLSKTEIPARVIKIDKTTIEMECYLSKDRYQTRLFNKSIFAQLGKLYVGGLIMIYVQESVGKVTISFARGEGRVDPQLFNIDHLFDGLNDDAIIC